MISEPLSGEDEGGDARASPGCVTKGQRNTVPENDSAPPLKKNLGEIFVKKFPNPKKVKQQNQIVCVEQWCAEEISVPVYQQDEGETLRAPTAASAEATTTNLRQPNQRRMKRNEFVSASVYALLFSSED